MPNHRDHFVLDPRQPSVQGRIVTLGPSGTSSECAAVHYRKLRGCPDMAIDLRASYEEATAEVLADSSAVVLIANAYFKINVPYMNSDLAIDTVFQLDTPRYGLVSLGQHQVGRHAVASHAAPVPLIAELSPEGFECSEVVLMPSTSEAAESVLSGRCPVGLTTEVAARERGLNFFSRARPIRMVWTVFRNA